MVEARLLRRDTLYGLLLVTNHSLLLYAVACWTSDGGSLGDAPERSQEVRCTSRVHNIVNYCV